MFIPNTHHATDRAGKGAERWEAEIIMYKMRRGNGGQCRLVLWCHLLECWNFLNDYGHRGGRGEGRASTPFSPFPQPLPAITPSPVEVVGGVKARSRAFVFCHPPDSRKVAQGARSSRTQLAFDIGLHLRTWRVRLLLQRVAPQTFRCNFFQKYW